MVVVYSQDFDLDDIPFVLYGRPCLFFSFLHGLLCAGNAYTFPYIYGLLK